MFTTSPAILLVIYDAYKLSVEESELLVAPVNPNTIHSNLPELCTVA